MAIRLHVCPLVRSRISEIRRHAAEVATIASCRTSQVKIVQSIAAADSSGRAVEQIHSFRARLATLVCCA